MECLGSFDHFSLSFLLPVTQHILPSATSPPELGKHAMLTALLSVAGLDSLTIAISWAIPYGFL